MSLFIRLCAAMFILIGGLALFFGLKGLRVSLASHHWPTAPARVVSSKVAAHTGDDGTTYHAEVVYEFEVNGQKQLSKRTGYSDYGSSDPSHAQSVVNRYPPGTAVTAHYQPDNPGVAVLETGTNLSVWGMVAIPATLFGGGLFGFIFLPGMAARRQIAEAAAAQAAASQTPAIAPPPISDYPRRVLPKLGRWTMGIFVAAVVATFALQHWFDHGWWGWLLPGTAILGIVLYSKFGVRCPQCRRRLRPRMVKLPPHRTAYLYECPDCRIAWDPEVPEPSAS